jgi:hypothetical protein
VRPGVAAGERQLVVAGIEAHVCVMQTVLEARRLGQEVHLCWEAVSSRGAEHRQEALERMRQAGAVVSNLESVAFEWARHKDHAQFKALSAILKQDRSAATTDDGERPLHSGLILLRPAAGSPSLEAVREELAGGLDVEAVGSRPGAADGRRCRKTAS